MVEQIAPLVKLTNDETVGGYIFAHRFLIEHYASLYTDLPEQPPPAEQA